MAIKATFSQGAGVLSVFGDSLDNTILPAATRPETFSSTAAPSPLRAAPPTVANTALIQVFGTGRQRHNHAGRSQRRAARRATCSAAPATTS